MAQTNQAKRPQKKPISRPTLSQTVTLNTPCAQRVFNRVYAEVSRNLYSLGVVTHVLSADESFAEDLNKVVKERFDELKEKLDDEIKRLDTVRDAAGVTAVPAYTEPQSIENDVSTPMTFHFIRLLQTLDKIVILLDSLWLTEEIDVKQKLRMEYMWQKRMLKFSNQLRELNNRARKASKLKSSANDEAAETETKAVAEPESSDKDAKAKAKAPAKAKPKAEATAKTEAPAEAPAPAKTETKVKEEATVG